MGAKSTIGEMVVPPVHHQWQNLKGIRYDYAGRHAQVKSGIPPAGLYATGLSLGAGTHPVITAAMVARF